MSSGSNPRRNAHGSLDRDPNPTDARGIIAFEARDATTIDTHQLRHSASTILLGEGIPLHEVCDILRHSSIAVTKDVYGHLVPERMQAAADTMDRALRRKPAS